MCECGWVRISNVRRPQQQQQQQRAIKKGHLRGLCSGRLLRVWVCACVGQWNTKRRTGKRQSRIVPPAVSLARCKLERGNRRHTPLHQSHPSLQCRHFPLVEWEALHRQSFAHHRHRATRIMDTHQRRLTHHRELRGAMDMSLAPPSPWCHDIRVVRPHHPHLKIPLVLPPVAPPCRDLVVVATVPPCP